MEVEVWKDISGYEGRYQVSNLGRIKSSNIGRYGKTHDRFLKPGISKCGYQIVALHSKNKQKTHSVHRLVATAFISNPENKSDVNHKDECKINNKVSNLEWLTRKDNLNYGTHNSRMAKSLTGVYNTKCSKLIRQLSLAGELVKVWPSANEVKRALGFDNKNISACALGKIKTAYGFKWEYI